MNEIVTICYFSNAVQKYTLYTIYANKKIKFFSKNPFCCLSLQKPCKFSLFRAGVFVSFFAARHCSDESGPLLSASCAFGHGRGEDEIVEFGIVGVQYLLVRPFPPLFALVNIDDFFAYLHYRVHVVRVDYGRYAVLLRYAVNQIVDDNRGLRVQTRIWLVAEQIARIHHNSPRNGYALNHYARQLRRIEMVGIRQIDAAQTIIHSLAFLRLAVVGKQIERQPYILVNGRRVDKRTSLKNHAYILSDTFAVVEGERGVTHIVEKNVAFVGRMQSDQSFEQYRFARTAASDNQIGLARLELYRDVFYHPPSLEGFRYVFTLYHVSNSCVRMRLNMRIVIELTTTARVEARPTSSELPLA